MDDEKAVRDMLFMVLARFNYQVLIAAGGLEGMELYREHAECIDLVLLDLSMPRMSGLEVLVELQALKPDIRVAILTGFSDDHPELAGIELIYKPFRINELLELVDRLLG
ncbi:MAG: response regulator [Candidatus Latescibacterota bacterium]